MTLFRIKKRKVQKQKKNKINLTIDAKHNETLTVFNKKKEKLQKYKNEKTKLEKRLNKLLKKKNIDLTDEELENKFTFKDRINELSEMITKIENDEEDINYFLNTGHLLYEYYENKNKRINVPISKTKRNQKKSVVDFFYKPQAKVKEPENKLNRELNKYEKMNKTDIVNHYYEFINKDYIREINVEDDVEYCTKCNIEKVIYKDKGYIICPQCGQQDHYFIDSNKPSYKNPPNEVAYFSYKRINHFNEWLAQFQAKESTDIPSDVYDKIILEIKKERITNMANLTASKLREILKKLKLNKYYEHVPHIINRINGIQAPTMSRETEEKLRSMFKEIQIPFIRHCPKDRKNFLSYSYVLHKFVELLGLDEFLPSFPLLKSREKLHQQDLIWEKICRDLGWEFIRSL